MNQVGDIISGIVTVSESYGIYAEASDGESYFIMLGELSWYRISRSTQVAKVGDEIEFKIFYIPDPGENDRYRLGSVKRAHPERNPWRDPSAYAEGIQFTGTVHNHVNFGTFIKHPQGAFGLLHIDDYDQKAEQLPIGQEFIFEITESNLESEQFRVKHLA